MNINRIIFIVDSLSIGGTERHILTLLESLQQDREFETILVIVNGGGALDSSAKAYANIYIPIDRKIDSNIAFVSKLIIQCQKKRPALLHTYGWMSNLAGLLVSYVLRIPIINGSIRNATPGIWHHRLSKWCARFSHSIVANSHSALTSYKLQKYTKAIVIHNGISLDRFKGIRPVTIGSPTICMVANFSDKKDQETVIKSLSIIHQQLPDVHLLLIGRDAGTLLHNRALAGKLNLGEKVNFITNTSRPEPYIASCEICILTSPKGEGISNSILEYMALQKPVIATDCGGNREVVVDKETGFLVPNCSPLVIAEKVIWLLQDQELSKKMGQAGYERVQHVYSLSQMNNEYKALYRQLLTNNISDKK